MVWEPRMDHNLWNLPYEQQETCNRNPHLVIIGHLQDSAPARLLHHVRGLPGPCRN